MIDITSPNQPQMNKLHNMPAEVVPNSLAVAVGFAIPILQLQSEDEVKNERAELPTIRYTLCVKIVPRHVGVVHVCPTILHNMLRLTRLPRSDAIETVSATVSKCFRTRGVTCVRETTALLVLLQVSRRTSEVQRCT